ncbi:hypothetical protein F4806DRAFT_490700 [Annulohypoxylon nitens]|nr:hypothetical protein F4806DRAFT_490700 [Annulohypoxylon nitens]
MPTVTGTVKSMDGRPGFQGLFVIDGIPYTFVGHMNAGTVPFATDQAKLEYTDASNLGRVNQMSGRIGPQNLSIDLGNGVKITGDLQVPVKPAAVVNGNGNWSQY